MRCRLPDDKYDLLAARSKLSTVGYFHYPNMLHLAPRCRCTTRALYVNVEEIKGFGLALYERLCRLSSHSTVEAENVPIVAETIFWPWPTCPLHTSGDELWNAPLSAESEVLKKSDCVRSRTG